VRAEAGLRFDPLVVDLLLDEADRESWSEPAALLPAAARPAAAVPLERADRELQMIYDVERCLALRLELEQRMTLAATRLGARVRFDGLALALGGPAGGPLRVRFACGPAAARLRYRLRVAEDPAGPGALCLAEGTTLQVPLVDDAVRHGTLVLYREDPVGFDPDERRLLVAVAGRVAAALTASQGERGLRRRSLTDAVTGLPNARYLRLECAQRLASSDPRFGLIVLQLRGVEALAERRGARAAGRLLARVGRELANGVRRGDVLVRFGADQFVVLSAEHESGALVTAWNRLAEIVPAASGPDARIRGAAAHVGYPQDGSALGELLAEPGRRLPAPERERIVVPFRATGTAS